MGKSVIVRDVSVAVAVVAIALGLGACVESDGPLLRETHPTLGQNFILHLYDSVVDGKASDFHASAFEWQDGRYLRIRGRVRELKSFVSQPLEGNDFIIQGTDEREEVFNYWIGRKLADGVYLIFPMDDRDADVSVRAAACRKGQPEGICMIDNYDDLMTIARATAVKPVRAPALGVILAK